MFSKRPVRMRTMKRMRKTLVVEKQCSHQDQQGMVDRPKKKNRKKKMKRKMMKRKMMMSWKTNQMI